MNKKIFYTIFIFASVFLISYFYISKNIDFYFEIESRNSVYINVENVTITDGSSGEKSENLMYCGNITENNDGVECGFYLNGLKFFVGRGG